jgi:MFS family permease
MVISLAASVYTGHSSSVRDEKRWHVALHLLIAAVGMAVGGLVQAPWLFYGCLVLAGIGTYAPMAVWWSYPTTFLSGPAAAGAIGLINSIGNLGGFFGPSITGFMREQSGGFAGAMLYLAVSLALGGLLVLTLRRTDAGAGRRGTASA